VKRLNLLIIVLLTTIPALAGCSSGAAQTAEPGAAQPLTSVVLPMGYIPNVQFAPLYVADSRGYFAENGIEIEFDYRPEIDAARLAGTGDLPFAIISGEQLLLARAQGLPLVYVFEWYQRFPVGIVARTDQGITEPADLAGHSVGVPMLSGASYLGLRALLSEAGLTEDDIDLQVTGYAQVAAITENVVDAAVIYVANEPVQLRALGEDVDVIYVADYADLVSNGLVTNETTVAENPALIAGMADAMARGLQYTLDDPNAAFEICRAYAEGLDDPEVEAVQRQVLAASIELWRADRLGESDLASWQVTRDALVEMGLLDAEIDLTSVFTNDFLPE
jgi:NitT/TauT family transport system substrate-binding protein